MRSARIVVLAAALAATPLAAAADQPGWTPSARDSLSRLFAGQDGQAAGQDAQPPPPRSHTGLRALAIETGKDFVAFPKRRSTWVILGVGAGLAALAHTVDAEVNQHLSGSTAADAFFAPGEIIGAAYTQVGVAVGLYAAGRWVLPHTAGKPKTNKLTHLGFDLLRAQVVSQVIVRAMRYSVRRDRPTGECCSFPSGHAATAFAAASVIERHFGRRLSWPAMAAATYVGMSRLHANRHYLSDVVFGAAVGTAIGWTVVGRHGRSTFALVPVPVDGGIALSLTRVR